jgi:membrane fusion protein (multidrug efflux system)/multidrug efflux system membrane fusion protein/cobalt-zinc-cadmium efflux system membrane fusion protein
MAHRAGTVVTGTGSVARILRGWFPVWFILAGIWLIGCGARSPEDKKEESVAAVPVRVMQLEPVTLEEVYSYTGDIQPVRQVKVFPDIPGKVAAIFVEEGDFVRKGQVLAVLDTTGLHLQRKQAEAGLAVARANFEDAKRNYERMLELKKEGSVSPQQFEKVELAYKAARAQLEQAEAALNLARHALDVSVMRAPFDGFIGGRFLNPGEMINPNMPGGFGVVSLVDISRVKLVVNVPEKEFYRIREGMPARITVDAYPGRVFSGKVTVVNPVADVLTRSFRVQIEADNPDYLLKPGMFARVEIVVQRKEQVVAVPVDAVLEEGGRFYVFLVRDARAHRVEVEKGITDGFRVEIVRGLKAGDSVVIAGQRNLRDGDVVRITNPVD